MNSATGLPEYLREASVRLHARLQKEITTSGLRMERAAKANLTGTVLNVRTGRLRRSIRSEVKQEEGGWELALRAGGDGAADVKYARIHELGGVIRPTQSRFLAIPVGPALTPSGVARYASPRDVPVPLAFVQSLKGQPLLVEAGGKKKAGRVWYVLRKSVTIPARPYLAPAMKAEEPVLAARLEQILKDALEGR